MDASVVYCSACDRNVRVVLTPAAGGGVAAESHLPSGVCLEYCSDACTGSMCAVFQVPTAEMRLKLQDGGHGPNC